MLAAMTRQMSVPTILRSSFTHTFTFWKLSSSVMSYTSTAPAPDHVDTWGSSRRLTLGVPVVDGSEGVEALLARRVPDGEVHPGARHHQLLHHEGGLGADREMSGHEYTCRNPAGGLDTCAGYTSTRVLTPMDAWTRGLPTWSVVRWPEWNLSSTYRSTMELCTHGFQTQRFDMVTLGRIMENE